MTCNLCVQIESIVSFRHTLWTRSMSFFFWWLHIEVWEKEEPWERPVNTRGGAYPGCSLSWTDRGSCSQGPTTSCLLSSLPSHSSSTSSTGSGRPSGIRGQGSRRAAGLFIVILPGKCVSVFVCVVENNWGKDNMKTFQSMFLWWNWETLI